MARHGENIYKRKDNRFEGRYIIGRDSLGKAKFGYVYGRTYRDVKSRLTVLKAEPEKRIPASEKSMGVFFDEWLRLKRSSVKESTFVKYRTAVNNHLKPSLGHILPRQLNTALIEEFSHGLLTAEKPLSPKTVKDVLTVLNAVIEYVKKALPHDVAGVEIVYPKIKPCEMRVLGKEEQAKLAKKLSADTDSVKFGILLALLTGLRIGELCALRWQDISLTDRTVTVKKTMQRLQGASQGEKTHIVIGDAKSNFSVRTIPLNTSAYELCKSRYVSDKDAYVLTASSRRFMEPRALQYRFARIAASCGLDGVHFHTLRHTFATRCAEAGFDVKSLSEILGHSSAVITLNRYVHSSLEFKRANMEKLEPIEF